MRLLTDSEVKNISGAGFLDTIGVFNNQFFSNLLSVFSSYLASPATTNSVMSEQQAESAPDCNGVVGVTSDGKEITFR